MRSQAKLILAAARAAFAVAMIGSFAFAVMPASSAPSFIPWDKANHFIAFYVLTGLGAAAFPRRPLWQVAAALSLYGALIECVQAIPLVNRDADVWDWVADTLAIGATLLPLVLVPWRRWLEDK